jgi:hypothetical protein
VGSCSEAVENRLAAALAPAWCAIVGARVLFAVGVFFSFCCSWGPRGSEGRFGAFFPKAFPRRGLVRRWWRIDGQL